MVPLNGVPGLTVFFTGLSGAGKTTLAEAPKGLYANAYEFPRDADLVIDTTHTTAEDAAIRLIHVLANRGCLSAKV